MGHQGPLRDTRRVGVVQPFHLESGEFRLDPLGHREVRQRTATVDGDQVAREGDRLAEQIHAA
jgi:hypothetical protein